MKLTIIAALLSLLATPSLSQGTLTLGTMTITATTATSPTTQTVLVPQKTVREALWADVNGETSVKAQWDSKQTVITYAWD